MECYECSNNSQAEVFSCPKYTGSINKELCAMSKKVSYLYLQRGYTLLDDKLTLHNLFEQSEELDVKQKQMLFRVCETQVLELIKEVIVSDSFEDKKKAVREAKRYLKSDLGLNEPDALFALLTFFMGLGISNDITKYLVNIKFNNDARNNKKEVIDDNVDLKKITKADVLQLISSSTKSSETFKKCFVPEQYEMIDNNAFENVKEIDYLILGSNISVIGNNAFSWAVIHQVRIPSSVKKISSNAFKGFTGVIECDSNSFACRYAMQRNIRYRIVN